VKGAFDWAAEGLAALEAEGLKRRLRASAGASLPEMELDGRRLVQFSSNNYLGLATHPRVLAAAAAALREFGAGTGASRLISGTQAPHAALERALAEFKGAEAALVYPSGSAANLGLLPSLAGEGDLIILDKACHATLYDGARLSGARIKRFPHNDLKRLAAVLAESKDAKKTVIVAEAVYSMDGDLAPLSALLAMAKDAGAMLALDEAHSTGVLGKTGRGILEHFSQAWHPNLVVTGTLSKALGSLGGFVAGPQSLIDWLVNSSRSFIFATALPASCAAAAHEALKVIGEEPQRMARLRENRERLALGLKAAGWEIGASQSPVIPVLLGPAWRATEMQEQLMEKGYYAPAIRPPTVPAGACRLRLSVSSEHSPAQIDGLLAALGKPA
jgi:8-amino-7-oxononanoate synthase